MSFNVWRKVSGSLKTTILYISSFILILGSVSFAAPLFFGQIAYAAAPTLVQADQNDPDTAWHTHDTTPTLTGATDADGGTVTVTVNGNTCISPVSAQRGWSCDGSFITSPLTENVLYPIQMVATNIDGSITVTDPTGVIVDTIAPVISERTPVPSTTSNDTPSYEFFIDSYGVITYGGGCSSGTTSAFDPRQTVVFSHLDDGLYDTCTLFVTDSAGNVSNTINISAFTVDTTGPVINPIGFKYWTNLDATEHAMSGDASSGWSLPRDGVPTTDYYIDFSNATIANENLGTGTNYHPLLLTGMTGVTSTDLTNYYTSRGVPAPFLAYLLNAITGGSPFAYIKTDGTTKPILIDAAKHDLLGVDVPMTVPGDYPEGAYTVSGSIQDSHGNSSAVSYELITADITAPIISNISTISSPTSDNTPDFSFDSDEAGTLNISGTGCSTSSSAVVSGSNTFTFNTLSDGTYDCSITVTDDSSNVSNSLNINQFTVDVAAPITNYSIVGGTIGDNGWYKGATAPTITLSTESSATIYWRWDSDLWTSGSTDQNPIVSEGTHTLEFYSVDPATNEELPHQTREVKYDATLPTADHISINSGDNWTNLNVVDIYTDSPTDSVSGVDRIMLSNDGVNFSTFSFANPYTGWALTNNDGQKTVYVKIVDLAGNESSVYTDTIDVDTVAPRVEVVQVTDRDAGFVDYNPYARGDNRIRVRALVYDDQGSNDSGLDTTTCEFTVDNTNWITGSYNPSTHRCYGNLPINYFTVDGQLVDGFNIRVRDNAGNLGTGTAVNRTIDTTAPVLGTMTIDPIYNDGLNNHTASSLHIEVTAVDAISGIKSCEQRVSIYDETSGWLASNWLPATYSGGMCQLDRSGLLDGQTYQFELRAIDNVEHISNVASSGPLIVDTVAPTIEYIDPTPADGLVTSNNIQTFVVKSSADTAACTIVINPGIIGNMTLNGDGNWQYTTSALGDGVYNYVTTCIDHVDNASVTPIRTITIDTLAPTITINNPNTNPARSKTITASTDEGTLSMFINGVGVNTCDASLTFIAYANRTFNSESDNGRTVCYRAIDAANNTSYLLSNVIAGIDRTAPATPTLISPVDGYITNNNRPTLSWNPVIDVDLDHYTFQICRMDPDTNAGVCSDQERLTSLNVTSRTLINPLVDGEYWWRVRSEDQATNRSPWSVARSMVIDTVLPDVASIDSDGKVFNLSTPSPQTIMITFSEDIVNMPTVVVRGATDTLEAVNNCDDMDEKTFCFDYVINPAEGPVTYTILVSGAMDAAGNVMYLDGTHTFIVDTIAPTANIVFDRGIGSGANGFSVQFSEPMDPTQAEDAANYYLTNWPGAGGSGDLAGDANVNYDALTNTATVTFILPGWYISPEQTWGVQNVHDLAGNVINPNPTEVTSTQMIPPITDINLDGDIGLNNIYISNVTVTLNAHDPENPSGTPGSGVSGTYYNLDNTGYRPYTIPFEVIDDGNHTVCYWSEDRAGNREAERCVSFRIDQTHPTITILPYNLLPTNQNITVYATTDEDASLNADSHLFTENGSFTFIAIDEAGNESEPPRIVTITNIDKIAPIITLNGSALVTLDVDNTYTELGATTNDGTPVTISGSVNTSVPGTYTINYSATDAAGNSAATVTRTVVVRALPVYAFQVNTTATDEGEVLGESTTDQDNKGSDKKGDVKGDSDSKKNDASESENGGGIQWYWWLVILAALGISGWWLFGAFRRKED